MAQSATPPTNKPTHPALRQAITGVVAPSTGEAKIREAWPTLLGVAPGLGSLAGALVRSYFLTPLGWLIQAPLFMLKFAPFLCKRYTLTNRRLMIQRGWKPAPVQEVPLAEIDDVRVDARGVDAFYLSGNLEVVSKGQVVMRLAGVPEPEGFRQAVLNAVKAWVPGKATGAWIAASAKVDGDGKS